MKKNIIAGLYLSCAVLLTACATSNNDTTNSNSKTSQEPSFSLESNLEDAYHKITAEEAKEMMDEGNLIIVDVRTEEEYTEAHIPKAILVPNESIDSSVTEVLPDKDEVLLVYCRTGVRSKQASDKLVELGYTKVYDFGGIVDWPYEKEEE